MSEKWTEPDREAEALAEGFFSQPDAVLQDAEGWEAAPMSAANRRAMLATLGLLAGCTVAGLAFGLLSEHVMVAPAELGGVASHEALTGWSAPATAPAAVLEPAPTPEPEPEPELAMAPATALAAATPQPAPEPQAQTAAAEPAPDPARPMQLSAKASPRSRPRRHQAAPPTTAPAGAAEQLTKRAYRELGQGRAREAEQLASRALVEDATRAGTYIVLAGARDALGDRVGALAAIRSCVKRATDRLATTCKTLAR